MSSMYVATFFAIGTLCPARNILSDTRLVPGAGTRLTDAEAVRHATFVDFHSRLRLRGIIPSPPRTVGDQIVARTLGDPVIFHTEEEEELWRHGGIRLCLGGGGEGRFRSNAAGGSGGPDTLVPLVCRDLAHLIAAHVPTTCASATLPSSPKHSICARLQDHHDHLQRLRHPPSATQECRRDRCGIFRHTKHVHDQRHEP